MSTLNESPAQLALAFTVPNIGPRIAEKLTFTGHLGAKFCSPPSPLLDRPPSFHILATEGVEPAGQVSVKSTSGRIILYKDVARKQTDTAVEAKATSRSPSTRWERAFRASGNALIASRMEIGL